MATQAQPALSLSSRAPSRPIPSSARATLRTRLALGAILVLGLGFRLWGITWGLQNANVSRRAHPDEWAIYWLFHWFDHTHSLNPCPRYPGQCFFDWGSAYPYLAYGLHFLITPFIDLLPAGTFGAQADPTFVRTILAARLVSALASTATIYVAYRLGRLLFGTRAGLIGALLVALSGLLIQLAHFATPDSTTILLMSATLLATCAFSAEPSTRRLLIAGGFIGLAAGSEYHMVLLAAPFLAAWWLSGRRLVTALGWAALAAGSAFLVLNLYLVIDFPGFLAAMEHTLRIRTVDSGLQYGPRWAPYGPAWLYVVRYPLGYGVGFALAGWLLLGVAWALVKRTRADMLFLAWLVPYFVLVTVEPAKFMRYSAPLLVPLAVLGGRFAVDVLEAPSRVRRISLSAIALATLVFTASYDAAYAGLFSVPDARASAVAEVNAQAAPGQGVAFEELPDGLLTMPYFLRRDLRACFLQQHPSRLAGAQYVLLDSYAREELGTHANAANERLQAQLSRSRVFRAVETIQHEPTFLGLRFPIDGSPHDWRYAAHRITVYRRVSGTPVTSPYCFTNLRRAARALYIPPSQRT